MQRTTDTVRLTVLEQKLLGLLQYVRAEAVLNRAYIFRELEIVLAIHLQQQKLLAEIREKRLENKANGSKSKSN